MTSEAIAHLLVISDSADDADLLAEALERGGVNARSQHMDTVAGLETLLREAGHTWDLVLARPNMELIQIASILGQTEGHIPLVVLSDDPADPAAVEALAYGARDIVPVAPASRLSHAVRRELDQAAQGKSWRQYQAALRECEQRAQTLIDSSRDAVAYIHDGMHVHANSVYLQMFGFDAADEITGIPLLDMVSPEDHTQVKELLRGFARGEASDAHAELLALHADGSPFRASVALSRATFQGEPCIQLVLRDLSISEPSEAELARLSSVDLLTGLYNRQYLIKAVEDAFGRASGSSEGGCLLYLELDGFRAVTERIGIAGSDLVLAEAATLLRDAAGAQGVAARFADEAFCLLLANTGLAEVQRLAETLRHQIEEHVFEVDRHTVILTCSIGLALIGPSAASAQEVLQAADAACGRARREGGNRVEVHQASLAAHVQEREWPRRVQEALQQDRFRLYFQPVVSLHGKPMELYEVLLRLLDPQGQIVLPHQFMAAAAKANLTPALDRWVITRATSTVTAQRSQGKQLCLLIKLSDETLSDETLVGWLVELLKSRQTPGDRFIFEVSEVSATTHLGQAKVFARNIKALHAQFALGHFGQGTNSLGILRHLPVDFVKINGALVHQVAQDSQKQSTVRSLIETAHSLGKLTIAENVEDANSLAVLWQLGVDYARGFYIQEPGPTLSFDFSASL
jgi:diguanylate cyclase (GGDEF)-like protein/PAS domain S-box-containing protein